MSAGGRSLPSWQNLKPPMSSHGQFDEDLVEPQMSDDELYLMNSKESSVLTSNLLTNESAEVQLEIISETANLRALCNLCESMVSRSLFAFLYLDVITRLFSYRSVYQAWTSITARRIAAGAVADRGLDIGPIWKQLCDNLCIMRSNLPIRQRINYFICHNRSTRIMLKVTDE